MGKGIEIDFRAYFQRNRVARTPVCVLACPGGRRKGAANKKTLALREVFESLQFDVPKRLVELLPDLEKEKQAKVLLELMGYLYPTGPEGQPIQITESRIQMKALIASPEAFLALIQIEKTLNETRVSETA